MNWQIIDSLPHPNIGVAGAFAGIHKGVMMVGGGANFPNGMPWEGGKKTYHDAVFVFTKNKNGSLQRHNQTNNLPEGVAYGASVSTPKGILCIGGENEKGATHQVFLLKWHKKQHQIEAQPIANLPLPLTNASATFLDNIVYVVGGESDNKTTNTFLSFDINEGIWKIRPNLPKSLSHTVAIAQNGCIYVAGGRAKTASGISDLSADLYVFDIKTNQWAEKKPLPYALTAGTGIALNDKAFLLFGGDKGETFHQVETHLAAIHVEKDSLKKQDLIQQKNKLLASHPGFSKDVLQYNILTNDWIKVDTMPFDAPVTTTAFKWGKSVIIPSGEIRAGVRTPHILAVDIRQNEK